MRNTIMMGLLLFMLTGSYPVRAGAFKPTTEFSVTRLSQNGGEPGEVITVFGNIGPEKPATNRQKCVYLWKDDKFFPCETIKWTDSSVKTSVPWGIKPGIYKLNISCPNYPQVQCNNSFFRVLPARKADLAFGFPRTIGFKRRKPDYKRSNSDKVGGKYGTITLREEDGRSYGNDGKVRLPMTFIVEEKNGVTVPSFRVNIYWACRNHVSHRTKVATLDNLAIGKFQRRTFKTNILIGPRWGRLDLEVDNNKKVVESNNGDNEGREIIYLGPLKRPDLIITKIKKLTKTPKAGKAFYVEMTVKNIGYGSTETGFEVGFKWGGSPKMQYAQVAALGYNETLKVKRSHVFTKGGKYAVTGYVNPRNKIKESNRKNNSKKTTFRVK